MSWATVAIAHASVLVMGTSFQGTLGPTRPSSAGERLAYAVSGADVVALGYILGVRDTVVNQARAGAGCPVRDLRVRIREWLEGDPGVEELQVRLPVPIADTTLQDLWDRSVQRLFLLRWTPDGWWVYDGAFHEEYALRAVDWTRRDDDVLTRDLYLACRQQRMDSVLARTEVAFVGRRVGTARCSKSQPGPCVRVRVLEAWAGVRSGETVLLDVPDVGDVPEGECLYLLRRSYQGTMVPVAWRAALEPVHAGRIERWGLTLDRVRAHLSSSARPTTPPPGTGTPPPR